MAWFKQAVKRILRLPGALRRRVLRRFIQGNPDSDYLNVRFLQYLQRSRVNTIFELGSRDGEDALALRDYFSAKVYAFECNPGAIELCRARLERAADVTLVEAAVWNRKETIEFYPVVQSAWRDGSAILDGNGQVAVNIGASSCYRARPDYLQTYEQETITVPAIRLDEFCYQQGLTTIDLLCIDVQGAALNALLGLGSYINTVSYIMIELEHREIYEGQSLYVDVDRYLLGNGFVQVASIYRDDWFRDYLYVRKKGWL